MKSITLNDLQEVNGGYQQPAEMPSMWCHDHHPWASTYRCPDIFGN